SLVLVTEAARTDRVQRNHVRANWLMGAASRISGDLERARLHLNEALSCCRISNLLEFEADILLDIAKLQVREKRLEAALSSAHQALTISERSDYALQAADVHLFLARVALENKRKKEALDHVKAAHGLAVCDGHPSYIYKVAHDEAEKLLNFILN